MVPQIKSTGLDNKELTFFYRLYKLLCVYKIGNFFTNDGDDDNRGAVYH